MKKLLTLLFAVSILSCSNDDDNYENPDLIGKWKLTEVLADPGDGSGTFQKVTSDKIIEFHSDGTITSNGSLCVMSIETECPTNGTFLLADSTIIPSDCETSFDDILKIRFKIKEDHLFIHYPCYEECISKFIKLK